MSCLRLVVIAASLMLATACGSDYVSPPAAPSPMAPSPSPSPNPQPTTPATAVAIPSSAATLGNRAYMPAELTVTPGTTVTWTNTDSVAHTSTSDAAGWNSAAIAPGDQFSFAFQTAGTFPYHCTIHPGMVGTVIVR